MSEQPQHPAVLILWNGIKPLLDKVSEECVGLKKVEFHKLDRGVAILHAVLTTGKLPPGVTMQNGAEAANPAEKPKPPAPPRPAETEKADAEPATTPDMGKGEPRRRPSPKSPG